MKIFKRSIWLAICSTVLLVAGCAPADRHFWYPIELKHATCGTFTGEIYVMENSIGWQSWPYYLEKATKVEIELGTDCTFRAIKSLQKHKRNVQDHLTKEQQLYLVEGF